MAIGTQDDSDEMLAEINMIPFIDVMLVLLIIFIITVPVIKHAVNIDLPRASNEKVLDKPENIRLSVDADGAYFWNETPRRCATSAWPWPWRLRSARVCARSASSPSR